MNFNRQHCHLILRRRQSNGWFIKRSYTQVKDKIRYKRSCTNKIFKKTKLDYGGVSTIVLVKRCTRALVRKQGIKILRTISTAIVFLG